MVERTTEAEGTRRSVTTLRELPPPDVSDPVIEAYKKDVDRTLLRENLKLTVQQRFQRFESFMDGVYAR